MATEILENMEAEQAYSNLELNRVIKKQDLSKQEINLLTQLVYGVTQHKMTIDYYLDPYLKKKNKIQNWVIQLLRLSVYQLVYLDRIPDRAVLNEAVNIAKERGHKGISGLVNGVLRNFLRNPLRSLDDISDKEERLSVQYSMPLWLVKKIGNQYDESEQLAILDAFLEESHTSIRVNTHLISIEEAIKGLDEEGIQVERSQVSQLGLKVKSGHVVDTSLFREGKITIQDESSMLVAPALDIEEGFTILDACAAPGGKTTHIASELALKGGGIVKAFDLYDHKVSLVKQNAKRQQVEKLIDVEKYDARKLSEKFSEGTFDRILVDAPCSGLGLMRRKPEIKYTKTPEDIIALKFLQLEILDSVSSLLKPGGKLVYSTCTITKEENKEVIEEFLDYHGNFEQIPVKLNESMDTHDEEGSISLLPHQYGTDGFFICTLRKKRIQE